MKKVSWEELANENLEGKIFVIPTDTIYGFSALSFDKENIKKINQIKKAALDKPLINLISSIDDLEKFDIELKDKHREFLEKIWPGKITVILKNKFNQKVSFRLPAKKELRDFIKKVGPIVSTSFNISGEKFQKGLGEIKKFSEIDFYINEAVLDFEESLILEIIR